MMFLLYKLNYLFIIIIALIIINRMKKVTINFIRHGQTSYNVLGKIQGSSDIKLTQEGIKQAYNCKMNKDIEYDIAYSSSLIRAKETLGIICNNFNKKPQVIINDLIIAAYNTAKENLKKKSAEELSKVTGGLNLPLDFKLPF